MYLPPSPETACVVTDCKDTTSQDGFVSNDKKQSVMVRYSR